MHAKLLTLSILAIFCGGCFQMADKPLQESAPHPFPPKPQASLAMGGFASATLSTVNLLIGQAPTGAPLTAEDLLAGAPDRIERYRKGDAAIRVVDEHGKPIPGARVTVRQTAHRFRFGGMIPYLVDRYEPILTRDSKVWNLYAGLFNDATIFYAWKFVEPEKNKPRRNDIEWLLRWCESRGISVMAQPLTYGQGNPAWLKDDPGDVEAILRDHVTKEVGRYRGRIDNWVMANEVPVARDSDNTRIADWFTDTGPIEALTRILRWAYETNPQAHLVINHFDATGPDYFNQLQGLIHAGSPLSGSGIQMHMQTTNWNLASVWWICERFAALGLPIALTELTVLSGESSFKAKGNPNWATSSEKWEGWPSTPEGEASQADYAEKVYTLLFSHPAVERIVWWDFTDRGAWLGAPAGLLRGDMSPKPAYDRLRKLIHEDWRTEASGTTDASGAFAFRGVYGDYEVQVQTDDPSGALRKTFTLSPDNRTEWTVQEKGDWLMRNKR